MNQNPKKLQKPRESVTSNETRAHGSTTPGGQSTDERRGTDALQLIDAVRAVAPGLLADVFDNTATAENPAGLPVVIDRFQIVRELGQGAHGVVFQAFDPRLKREVALKVPRPNAILSEDLRRRFVREAEAAALLNHPNIVPIYETGSSGPVMYIASALCPGISLDRWRQKNECDQRMAAKIVASLADATEHAHQRGILHRDIKPGNVLVNESGNGDLWETLQLSDFGLAQVEGDIRQTQTNAILGTPAFMAPEQAAGLREQVGPGTDVYALGATLYYLLTGAPPIVRDTNLATLEAIRSVDAPSLSSVDRSIARDLSAICEKCLEKDPADRYSSAHALREDLQRFLNGESVTVRPAGLGTQFRRWAIRNRKLATALGTLVAVLVLFTGLTTFLWLRGAQRLDEARSQAKWSRAAVDQLLVAIADDIEVRKGGGMERFREQLLTMSAAYFDDAASSQPSDPEVFDDYFGSVNGLAKSISALGEHQRAIDMRESFMERSKAKITAKQKAIMMLDVAYDWSLLRRTDHAVKAATGAAQLVESLPTNEQGDEAALVKVMSQLAAHQSEQGNAEDASRTIDSVIAVAKMNFGQDISAWPNNGHLARALTIKCGVAVRLSEWHEVLEIAPVAIRQLGTFESDPAHESFAWEGLNKTYKYLSKALLNLGNLGDVEEALTQESTYAEKLIEKHDDRPVLLMLRHVNSIRRAWLETEKGDLDAAEERTKKTMEQLNQLQADYPELTRLVSPILGDCQKNLERVSLRRSQ